MNDRSTEQPFWRQPVLTRYAFLVADHQARLADAAKTHRVLHPDDGLTSGDPEPRNGRDLDPRHVLARGAIAVSRLAAGAARRLDPCLDEPAAV
jgi:hypothetical protein